MSEPSVGDVLGAAGASPTIPCNGKVWKLGHPTQAAKDRLEKLVVAEALENVKAAETGVLEIDKANRESLFAAIRQRKFRTGGEEWVQTFSRPEGQVMFALSLLQEHHPDATAADVLELLTDAGDAFAAALLQVVPGFFFIAAGAMGLPEKTRRQWARGMAEKFAAGLSPPSSSPPPSGT